MFEPHPTLTYRIAARHDGSIQDCRDSGDQPPGGATLRTLRWESSEFTASSTGFDQVHDGTNPYEDPQRAEILLGPVATRLLQLSTDGGAVCLSLEGGECLLPECVDELTSIVLRNVLVIAETLMDAWAVPDLWRTAEAWTRAPALAELSLREEVQGRNGRRP